MLEKDFKDMDNDFMTAFSRFKLNRSAKNKARLRILAESGQFNAALVCFMENIHFKRAKFKQNFDVIYGESELFQKIIETYEDFDIDRRTIKRDEKNLDSLLKTLISKYNMKVKPQVVDDYGEIRSVDEDIVFSGFLTNEHEEGRGKVYGDLCEMRKIYNLSLFMQGRVDVMMMLKSELEKGRVQYAGLLDYITKSNDYVVLPLEVQKKVTTTIVNNYTKDRANPSYAFAFANMVDMYGQTKVDYGVDEQLRNKRLIDEKDKIFNLLAGRPFITLPNDKVKNPFENTRKVI